MIFTSDNAVGAHPAILEAIGAANGGALPSYGADEAAARVEARLREVFETDLRVFLVVTGTAANALALATLCPPWGAVFCHRDSHAEVDECGAPEFYGGGLKLVTLPGARAKIDENALRAAVAETGARGVHQVQPAALTLTNVTEAGALYTPDETAGRVEIARAGGAAAHLDGTRFANAIAASGRSAADLSWRAGIDVLCLGATKGGALAAEAVIFFEPERNAERIAAFEFRRKRGGHLLSKGRLLSAQMEAWLADDLWLDLAGHANAMAARLSAGLGALPGVEVEGPVEANMIFATLPQDMHRALRAAGAGYYVEPAAQDEGAPHLRIRLVTSWATTPEQVDAFLAAARGRQAA